MIIPILLVFSLLLIIHESFFRDNSGVKFSFFLIILLACIAAFRSPLSPDYKEYVGLYNIEHENKEIGYLTLIRFSKLISSNHILFFFLSAALSITLKVFAIRLFSPFFSISLIVYISNVFILHDMIQMRCAISSGLLLWALYFYCKDDLKKSLSVSFLALLFHYSSVVIFLLYFLSKDKFDRGLALCFIAISYILAILGLRFGYIWGYITWGEIASLWEVYSSMMASGEMTKINIFNTFFIIRIIVCVALIINYDRIKFLGRLYVVGLKLYVISICVYLLFSDIPVLAFRLSELFQVVEVFLFSSLIIVFNDRSLGKLCVTALATAFILINIFYNQLVL